MIALGAKGSFPSSSDDATKLTNIIPLSNPHTRTTGFQGTRMYMADLRGRRTAQIITIILRKTPDTFREMSCSSRRRKVFSARDFEHCSVVASEHANRKSHPLHASLAQAEEVRTRRHAGEIDISSQNHNVVFEFSHSTRAEKFSSTRIE